MKPVLLTLLFLLFAFPLAFSKDAQQVLDAFGNPLVPGGEYYMVPAIFGPPGGGVRLGMTGNSRCPVTVLQDYSEVVNGMAVKFSIPGESTGEIFTGTPLEIEFTKKPKCAESSKWVVFVDSDIQQAYVGIGGPEDHPDQQTLNGTFRIQKQNYGYKLVFCVTRLPTCFDIGRFDNRAEGGRRLVLTDNEPYNVIFIQAATYSRIKSVV